MSGFHGHKSDKFSEVEELIKNLEKMWNDCPVPSEMLKLQACKMILWTFLSRD